MNNKIIKVKYSILLLGQKKANMVKIISDNLLTKVLAKISSEKDESSIRFSIQMDLTVLFLSLKTKETKSSLVKVDKKTKEFFENIVNRTTDLMHVIEEYNKDSLNKKLANFYKKYQSNLKQALNRGLNFNLVIDEGNSETVADVDTQLSSNSSQEITSSVRQAFFEGLVEGKCPSNILIHLQYITVIRLNKNTNVNVCEDLTNKDVIFCNFTEIEIKNILNKFHKKVRRNDGDK